MEFRTSSAASSTLLGTTSSISPMGLMSSMASKAFLSWMAEMVVAPAAAMVAAAKILVILVNIVKYLQNIFYSRVDRDGGLIFGLFALSFSLSAFALTVIAAALGSLAVLQGRHSGSTSQSNGDAEQDLGDGSNRLEHKWFLLNKINFYLMLSLIALITALDVNGTIISPIELARISTHIGPVDRIAENT